MSSSGSTTSATPRAGAGFRVCRASTFSLASVLSLFSATSRVSALSLASAFSLASVLSLVSSLFSLSLVSPVVLLSLLLSFCSTLAVARGGVCSSTTTALLLSTGGSVVGVVSLALPTSVGVRRRTRSSGLSDTLSDTLSDNLSDTVEVVGRGLREGPEAEARGLRAGLRRASLVGGLVDSPRGGAGGRRCEEEEGGWVGVVCAVMSERVRLWPTSGAYGGGDLEGRPLVLWRG